MIAVVPVSASRNGFASSQLAPIPLNSNSGGPLPLPCRIATWSNWPSIVICRASISGAAPRSPPARLLVKDISPRSSSKHWMAFASQRRDRRNFFARSCVQPIAPVEPPASLALLSRGQECVRAGWIDGSDHEGGLRIGRRVDEALEMAAVRKHEGRPLAHDLGGLVHTLPRSDVVGHAGDHVTVDLGSAHVDRLAVQRELSGVDERVREIEIQVIAMQTGWKSGCVGIPVQDIVCRLLLEKKKH